MINTITLTILGIMLYSVWLLMYSFVAWIPPTEAFSPIGFRYTIAIFFAFGILFDFIDI